MADIRRQENADSVTLSVKPFPETRPLMEIVAEITGHAGRNPEAKVRFTGASVTEMFTLSELSVWLGVMRQMQATMNTERDKLKAKPAKKR